MDIQLEEKLIELVKETPFLYNIRLAKYRNAKLKIERFKEIGGILGLSGDATAKLWWKLRIRYLNYLRKCKSGAKVKFRHAKALEFCRENIYWVKDFNQHDNDETPGSATLLNEMEETIGDDDDDDRLSEDSNSNQVLEIEEEPFCVFCWKSMGFYEAEQEKGARLLDKELKIMFVVHKLLKVPGNVTEEMLRKFGNPSGWIKICWACEDMVNESKSIYDRIQHLEKSLQKFKDAAGKKIKESENKKQSKGLKNRIGPAGILRQAVLNGNTQSFFVDPTSSKATENHENVQPIVKCEAFSETQDDFNFINEALDEDLDSFSPIQNDNDDSFHQTETGDVPEAITGDVDDNDDDDDWVPDSNPVKRRRTYDNASIHSRNKKRKVRPIYATNRVNKDCRRFDKDGRIIYQKCHLCKLSYPRRQDLLRHFRVVHDHFTEEMMPKAEGYTCEICKLCLETVAEINEHKLSKHPDKIVKCPHCPKVYYLREKPKLTYHIGHYHENEDDENESPHDDDDNDNNSNSASNDERFADLTEDEEPMSQDKEYKCSLCDYQTNLRRSYFRHRREVHWESDLNDSKANEKQNCKECGEDFSDLVTFRNHCLEVHKMFECKFCPRVFPKSGLLVRHVRKIHNRNKCKIVEVVPTSTEDLKNPSESQKEEEEEDDVVDLDGPYKCDHCDYVRGSKKQVENHIRMKHWILPKIPKQLSLSTMDCKCTVCDENFLGGDALKKHCVDVHSLYVCNPCNRVFATKYRFQVHRDQKHNIPFGTKRFKCHFCPKRFEKQFQLTYHLRACHFTYVGTKFRIARKCRHCGTCFDHVDAFISHSIEKHGALQCEICPRLFETRQRLAMHMMYGHEKNLKNYPSSTEIKDIQSGSLSSKNYPSAVKKDSAVPIVKEEQETSTKESQMLTKTLQCPYCTFCCSAGKKGRYNEHMEKIHYEIVSRDMMTRGEEVTLKCNKCALTSFTTVDELLQHKIETHNLVKCEICLHCLPSKGYRQRHWDWYHAEDAAAKWVDLMRKNIQDHARYRNRDRILGKKAPDFRCQDCDIKFRQRYELFKHNVKEHPEKLFKCDLCPETDTELYETLGKLYAHKVLVHDEPKDPYRCRLCDYTARSYRLIEQHKESVHFPKPKVICEICSKQYSNEKILTWHKIREHGVRSSDARNKRFKLDMLMCKLCNKIFSSPYYMRTHVRNYHLNQSHYKCTHEGCTLSFNGQKQLDLHIRLRHTKEGILTCPHEGCGRQCGTKAMLKGHIARVHSPKTMKCPHCDYATNDKFWLKRHLDVHENAETRPYQCNICGKNFPAFRYLTQHFNSHIRTGEMDRSERPTYSEYVNKLNLFKAEVNVEKEDAEDEK